MQHPKMVRGMNTKTAKDGGRTVCISSERSERFRGKNVACPTHQKRERAPPQGHKSCCTALRLLTSSRLEKDRDRRMRVRRKWASLAGLTGNSPRVKPHLRL